MKILFVDCDGTIREPLNPQNTFISHPRDQKIISGADKAIDRYHQLGYHIYGITNQGGVAKGKKNLSSCIEEQRYTLTLFPQIKSIFFCPDDGKTCWEVKRRAMIPIRYDLGDLYAIFADSNFRKPGSGMLELILQGYDFPEDCLMVGDRPEDEGCAQSARIPFIPASTWRETIN